MGWKRKMRSWKERLLLLGASDHGINSSNFSSNHNVRVVQLVFKSFKSFQSCIKHSFRSPTAIQIIQRGVGEFKNSPIHTPISQPHCERLYNVSNNQILITEVEKE